VKDIYNYLYPFIFNCSSNDCSYPKSKIQKLSVVETEKTYLQWHRCRHGGENVWGQYFVSHTTKTKNNPAKWGRKRKIFG